MNGAHLSWPGKRDWAHRHPLTAAPCGSLAASAPLRLFLLLLLFSGIASILLPGLGRRCLYNDM